MKQAILRQPPAEVVAMLAVLLAVFAVAASAFGISTPRLGVNDVKQVARRAAQFQPSASTAYIPDNRLTVERVRLSDAGKQFVWDVELHSTVVVFPCKLPPPWSRRSRLHRSEVARRIGAHFRCEWSCPKPDTNDLAVQAYFRTLGRADGLRGAYSRYRLRAALSGCERTVAYDYLSLNVVGPGCFTRLRQARLRHAPLATCWVATTLPAASRATSSTGGLAEAIR